MLGCSAYGMLLAVDAPYFAVRGMMLPLVAPLCAPAQAQQSQPARVIARSAFFGVYRKLRAFASVMAHAGLLPARVMAHAGLALQ